MVIPAGVGVGSLAYLSPQMIANLDLLFHCLSPRDLVAWITLIKTLPIQGIHSSVLCHVLEAVGKELWAVWDPTPLPTTMQFESRLWKPDNLSYLSYRFIQKAVGLRIPKLGMRTHVRNPQGHFMRNDPQLGLRCQSRAYWVQWQ